MFGWFRVFHTWFLEIISTIWVHFNPFPPESGCKLEVVSKRGSRYFMVFRRIQTLWSYASPIQPYLSLQQQSGSGVPGWFLQGRFPRCFSINSDSIKLSRCISVISYRGSSKPEMVSLGGSQSLSRCVSMDFDRLKLSPDQFNPLHRGDGVPTRFHGRFRLFGAIPVHIGGSKAEVVFQGGYWCSPIGNSMDIECRGLCVRTRFLITAWFVAFRARLLKFTVTYRWHCAASSGMINSQHVIWASTVAQASVIQAVGFILENIPFTVTNHRRRADIQGIFYSVIMQFVITALAQGRIVKARVQSCCLAYKKTCV